MNDQRRDLVAEFEAAYATTQPWDIGRPQCALVALAAEVRLAGDVLDVGSGTGAHALMAAEAGCVSVGVDVPSTALRLAEDRARERGISTEFVGGALHLESLGEQFDVVLDCGPFHVFDDQDRQPFVESLTGATRPGGRYHMRCFGDEEPIGWGPRRITQSESRDAFVDGWKVGGTHGR